MREKLDFKELILSLRRIKWLILGVAIIAGILAFLVSSYLVPTRYQSSVVVSITDFQDWNKLYQINLYRIAKSDDLIDQCFAELGITDPDQRRSMVFSISMEYWGLLELHVVADDPIVAADGANTWAHLVYERTNEVLGTSQEELIALKEEVSFAEDTWLAAQIALEDFLLDSRLELFAVQQTASQASLTDVLQEIERNRLLISDARTLLTQIEGMNSTEIINSGVALSLMNLQGRATAVGGEPNPQTQENLNNTLDLSLADALMILKQFISALENQNEQLNEEAIALENKLISVVDSLAYEQQQIEQFELKRDVAKSTYISLRNQLDDFVIEQNRVKESVKISTQALPPTESIKPSTLGMTMVAGLSAAIFTILVKIISDWWVGRDPA